MNFEDEEYIRVYTRNTATTKKLGWEGRTVLWHLERIVQKSGVLELEEGDDLVEVVAALCDLPEDITKLGLVRLASRGVTVRHAASLEIVRFVEAQNAKRSDRLRAQDYRDRQKAEALISVEKRADASRSVTERHVSSLLASPLLALPCLPPPPPEPVTVVVAVVNEDRETACPGDLCDRAEQCGMFPELSGALQVPEASLRAEARDFMAYWTIGAGMGKRRGVWMGKLRQRLVERAQNGHFPKLRPVAAAEETLRAEALYQSRKRDEQARIDDLNRLAQAEPRNVTGGFDLAALTARIG